MSMPTRPDSAIEARSVPVPRRRGPLGAVQRFPLISFYVVACAASWLGWLPYVLSAQGQGILDFNFPGGPEGSQLLGVLPGAYIGPLGAALLVTAVTGGREGLRAWRRRLFRLRVGWHWYAIVLIGVPITMVSGAFGIPGLAESIKSPPVMVLAVYLPALLIQVVTTGLAEEPGWRDFALPLMQRRMGPAVGTAVLGVVWAFWHLPLFFTDWSLGGKEYDTAHWWITIGVFTIMCVAISYPITWVFNHTKESLPVALLLHASNNTVASIVLPEIFPDADGVTMLAAGALGYGLVSVVLLGVTRGRLGYRGPRD
ncbi:CPBP family intramembrane glutamic endopeptidase [Microtetraspora sp. NBRC 16547]|uniref:CPBP family intramembrane glutamic endopeptidase n=1 Tax=Microtetraspora sp. NBRC 16547 TaxID=3030993 RepID=UPI0024A02176|nr:CPBP family intramembrane glutamic endopeptidase [Microtetraspora sp. NBRC 16547]GLW98843.1 CAAX amino protease [Microtetraspora sp. NBRC 16547]